MKKVILGFSLLGLISAAHAKDVEEYMDDIKKPNKYLKRAIKKDAAGADSLKNAKELIKASKAFAKFKHKDDKFNKLNKDFQKAIEAFEKAVETKKADEIKKAFDGVKKTCGACHDAYDV